MTWLFHPAEKTLFPILPVELMELYKVLNGSETQWSVEDKSSNKKHSFLILKHAIGYGA
jgi:hypothetical protein